MNLFSSYLQQLYSQTKELSIVVDKLLQLSNEDQDVEQELKDMQNILDARDITIKEYQSKLDFGNPSWSDSEKELLSEIKQLQESIEPKLREIQSTYNSKLFRFNQGKTAAKGYSQDGYQSDGAFIDKKK